LTAYRNKLNKLLKAAQIEYYANKFHNIKSHVKQNWSLIKHILNTTNRNQLYDKIKIGDRTISDQH